MAKVTKRGNSWVIDYTAHGKRIRKSFKNKKLAKAELAKRISLIAEGRYLDVKKDCKTTLGELVERYIENYQHQASYKTGKRYFLKTILAKFGEHTLLSNISYYDLETFRNRLRREITRNGTIRSDGSTNRVMACISHLFQKGVEWELIEVSPLKKGRSLLLKENNKRLRFFTKDEIARLLSECSPYLKNICICAVHSGMRKSEILNLKWSQIRNGFVYLRETKNNESRELPISDDLSDLFKSIRRVDHFKSDYVFLNEGKRIKCINTGFRGALRRAKIDNARFHDLRHTFASHIVMEGGHLKSLQQLLGHKTLTMTLRYAHLSENYQKQTVNLLNGLTSCHKTVTKSELRKSEGQ